MKKPARKRASKARKSGKSVLFLHKPTCATCRKARHFMEKRGYHLQFRDLWKERLTAAELEKLIGDGDHIDFLNKRSNLYLQKKMREKPPSRREAIRMMVKEPNLIRRPVIVAGGRVVLGFDEKGMVKL